MRGMTLSAAVLVMLAAAGPSLADSLDYSNSTPDNPADKGVSVTIEDKNNDGTFDTDDGDTAELVTPGPTITAPSK